VNIRGLNSRSRRTRDRSDLL